MEVKSMQDLHSYRAYFLSANDRIRAVSGFKSTDDAAACEEADLMLEQSEYAAIEIYEGWRLIWHKDREQRAA
jgi:hypothetical protein